MMNSITIKQADRLVKAKKYHLIYLEQFSYHDWYDSYVYVSDDQNIISEIIHEHTLTKDKHLIKFFKRKSNHTDNPLVMVFNEGIKTDIDNYFARKRIGKK